MRSRSTVAVALLGLTVALGAVVVGVRGRRDAAASQTEAARLPTERVRVEVLNAGGVSRLAGIATGRLRDAGYDVVHFGNAPSFDRDTTVVIDRVGRPDFAAAVANAIGIRNVLTEPDTNLFVDVTVLLGRDWPGSGDRASVPPPRAPWDPRGWFGR